MHDLLAWSIHKLLLVDCGAAGALVDAFVEGVYSRAERRSPQPRGVLAPTSVKHRVTAGCQSLHFAC